MNIFSPQFLFQSSNGVLQQSDKVLGVIIVALIALAVIMKIAAIYAPNPIDKKYRERWYGLFITIGILALLWLGALYQNLRFIQWRFFVFFIFAIGIIWAVRLIMVMVKAYRAEKQNYTKEQLKLRYLPK